jgi:hypothetical protein
MPKKKSTKARPKRHRYLPNFILLFNRIGYCLNNPQTCSPAELHAAQEAFNTIIMTIYPKAPINACHFDPPTIKPVL